MFQSLLSITGRAALVAIFLMSAVGNKIPNYSKVAAYMASEGVPAPKILLGGAIAFLIVGGALVLVGYKARLGATLLLIFLILATYFFHDFWTVKDLAAKEFQMIQFLKNLSLAGAMLFIIANGPGAGSLESVFSKRSGKK